MSFEAIWDEVLSFESAALVGQIKDLKLKISPEKTENLRNKNLMQLSVSKLVNNNIFKQTLNNVREAN